VLAADSARRLARRSKAMASSRWGSGAALGAALLLCLLAGAAA
jgi:hypothetical protein